MGNEQSRAAVGAGTTAGDAEDEEQSPESRAAEAEMKVWLESLAVTGADVPDPGQTEVASRPPRADQAPIRPEQPREDLRNNQAGIAGRLDRSERQR